MHIYANEKEPTRFYVYAYIRSKSSKTGIIGTPYYIGKGTANRCNDKHRVPVPKDKSFIVFLETNLTNIGACALERRYIRWYGRKDIGTGILLNMTDGGDSNTGWSPTEETRLKMSISAKNRIVSEETKEKHRNRVISKETREKQSLARTGKTHTDDSKQKMKGRIVSDETKELMRIAKLGRKHSPESIAKMRAAKLGKKMPRLPQ